MVKKLIKKIAKIFYDIGYYENLAIKNAKQQEFFQTHCQIDSTAWIGEDASIKNTSRPKDCLKIGANSRIMGEICLFDIGGAVEIGADCFVGKGTKIWSAAKITIGNRVLISHNVNIHDNISHPIDAQARYDDYNSFIKTGDLGNSDIKPEQIVICDDVWIGFNSTILRGVTIGQGAIIGAGSFVTKDVAPWTVNVGNPVKCIKVLEPIDVKVVS